MSQVINTNVLSLTAQRNLQSSQSELAQSLQRLSSGLRINSAKDDAAGLAISERFTTQIRGLNQAIRNANDGISLSQTGEAALSTVTDNLQRIRELAVQSVNATNSNADRAALNLEVQQRLAEIDRIATQTSFNGRNVLDGTFGNAVFQVGANVGQTIALGLDSSVRTSDIGQVAQVTTDATPFTSTSAPIGTFTNFTLTGTGQTATVSIGAVDITVTGTDNAGNTDFVVGDFATAIEGARADLEAAGFALSEATVTGTNLPTLIISRVDGAGFEIADSVAGASGIQNQTVQAAAGVTLGSGDLSITVGTSDPVEVTGTFATAQALADGINAAFAGNALATLNPNGTVTLTANETIAVTSANAGVNVLANGSGAAAGGSLAALDVLTVVNSNTAIQRIDSALSSVSDLRSTFGAIQNRFESTIENLTTTSENLQASRSRIQDADFAAETANLTRVQILQQAGISVLAQANVQPQNVLALLQ